VKTSRIKCFKCRHWCGATVTEATPAIRAQSPHADLCEECLQVRQCLLDTERLRLLRGDEAHILIDRWVLVLDAFLPLPDGCHSAEKVQTWDAFALLLGLLQAKQEQKRISA